MNYIRKLTRNANLNFCNRISDDIINKMSYYKQLKRMINNKKDKIKD